MKNRIATLATVAVVAAFGAVSRAADQQASESTAPNALAEPAKTSHVREIIVVCKTHFDIGYTHRVKDIVQYYRTTMIDRALEIMDESADLPAEQQFAWTAPGWVMAKVLEDWPGQTPERRRKLEDAFKSGKFVTHALPFTVESDFMEPEDFARGYRFSSFVSRKYGLPLPRDAKMTDVPSHGSLLATALAQGGVKFMHIGCNWPSGDVKYPPLFWWEGPDGSRVLTMYSSIYGTCTALWPARWLGKKDTGIGHNLLPPAGWPFRTWAAIIVTPDNSGPPKAEAVRALFAEASRKLPGVRVRMGRMEDFADAILAEKPELPVVKGDAPDAWVHGCMSDPRGVRTARTIRPLMPAVEALNTQLRTWGIAVPDAAEELARAYEQSLLYSEHTWGGAASVRTFGDAFRKLPPGRFTDLEGSWEDKTDYIRTAGKITTSLLATNLTALAKGVDCAGPRIVVFNPLPWKRNGVVVVPGHAPLLARDVPPLGYKTYRPTEVPRAVVPARPDALENEFFKIALDPARGVIQSLVDKRTGREWVEASAAFGLGQYLNERFDADQTDAYCRDYQQGRAIDRMQPGEWLHPGMSKPGLPPASQIPYHAATPRNGTLRFERSGVSGSAIMDFPADATNHLPATTLRVTLDQAQPFVELELTIRNKAKDNWPEADWLCLPFQVASPRFCVGRPLGMMDPARDILRGADRHVVAVGTGVMLTGADGAGIALCPLDHPLVSLDTPGCWKFSLDFVPKKPVVFVNLYNNQWNTNYRCWYTGTWSSRVRVWTFGKGSTPESALVTPALEARNPLAVAVADGPAGKLPLAQSGLSVSRPGVLVTAFGQNPDGQGTLLRVWEQGGVSGRLSITLPPGAKFATATPVNLRGERTGRPISITGGAFSVDLHAYAPASFVME